MPIKMYHISNAHSIPFHTVHMVLVLSAKSSGRNWTGVSATRARESNLHHPTTTDNDDMRTELRTVWARKCWRKGKVGGWAHQFSCIVYFPLRCTALICFLG